MKDGFQEIYSSVYSYIRPITACFCSNIGARSFQTYRQFANAPKKEKKEATQNIDVGDITTQIGQAGRFYKGFVVLEVKGKKTPETIKAKMPQIKDSIITSISAMTPNEIASPEGMSKLKEKIKNDANAIIESETKDVVSVLFTESIIQ